MARWTRFALRFRWPILGVWPVILLAGLVIYKARNGSAGLRLKLERSIAADRGRLASRR